MSWLTTFRQAKALQQSPSLLRTAASVIRLRRAVAITAAVTVLLALVFGAFAAVVMLTAPVTAPVTVAGKVLGAVAAEVFGDALGTDAISGSQLAEAGRDIDITCKPQPVPVPAPAIDTSAGTDAATETATAGGTDTVTAAGTATDTAPIPVNADGSLHRDDAKMLVDAVPVRTSALTAQVWFLYRLAGIGGDWPGFIAAYHEAGLRGDDESDDAAMSQVRRLNRTGVAVDGYRLTAAALAEAGLLTGRFTDPNPGYRQQLMAELMDRCLDGTGLDDRRVTPPLPASGSWTRYPGDAKLNENRRGVS